MLEQTLTKEQARRFILAHHGLWPPRRWEGEAGVLTYVDRVGCIQFDPLDVVGRNPDLVLQSRIADYRPAILENLLYERRRLVDGWDKNAAIYPVEDWPFFERRRRAARRNPGKSPEAVNGVLPQVRRIVEERGPLSSLDLDLERTVDWSWGPTRVGRATLESMYNWGELIVHHRVHTRKVYDFARRHLPEDILAAPDPNPSQAAYHDWYVLRRIGGLGLIWNRARGAWLGMGGIKSKKRTAALVRLREQEKVVPVTVEGVDPVLYMRSEDREGLERVLSGDRPTARAAVIAPLDNLLWDRRFIEVLFDFSYTWEVYKPAAERVYGYYVLPVLYGDRFVARFQPEQNQEKNALVIKNWWWEPDVTPSEPMRAALRDCFAQFLNYLDLQTLGMEERTAEEADLAWLQYC